MKKITLSIILMTATLASWAQINTTLSLNYGGPGYDQMDRFYQAADGGYYWCGHTKMAGGNIPIVFGNDDAWFMKVDANGDSIHSAVFGGSGYDYLKDVLEVDDTTYVLLLNSNSTDNGFAGGAGNYDVWIKGYNFTPELSSGLPFGGTANDIAIRITPRIMGGFLVTGTTWSSNGSLDGNYGNSDIWLMSLQPNLTIAWSKHFGGSSNDDGIAAYQLADGNIMLFGNSASTNNDVDDHIGNNDVWVVKLNSMGDILWTKSYGGTNADVIFEVKYLSDTTFALVGASNSNDGNFMFRDRVPSFFGFYYVIDENGDYVNGGSMNTLDNYAMFFTDVCFDSPNYAMAFGVTNSDSIFNCSDPNHGDHDICIVDYNGIIDITTHLLGGDDDEGVTSGNAKYVKAVKTGTNTYAFCTNTRSTNLSTNFHGLMDVWLNVFEYQYASIDEFNTSQLHVYPNPSNGQFYINVNGMDGIAEMNIYSISGQIIYSEQIDCTKLINKPMDISAFSKGIYFIRLVNKNASHTEKIIIE